MSGVFEYQDSDSKFWSETVPIPYKILNKIDGAELKEKQHHPKGWYIFSEQLFNQLFMALLSIFYVS
jgi:hypothetical protein